MHKHQLISRRNLGLAVLCAAWLARPASAQTPTTYQACYVPNLGALYLIGLPGLPTACLATSHVLISWTDGSGALRTGTTAAGDLSGTLPNPTVARLQGTAVASTAPTSGQVLAYNGTAWAPAANGFSGAAGGDLSGTYPNPTVARLEGTSVASTAPTSGQVLAYNGTAWAPAANGVSGAAGGDLSGTYPNPTVARLQGTLNTTNGFAVTGTFGTGTIPATGAGVRLMWYPGMAAFRAGGVAGTNWDVVGDYSIAMGLDTKASANYSTALGAFTVASQNMATAMGNASQASGVISTAMGYSTTASGPQSTAMGQSTVASDTATTAMGMSTNASAPRSTAMGYATTASGIVSTAMGGSTVASGIASTSMGENTHAVGNYSTAMGWNTQATADASTSMGLNTMASGLYSTAMGTNSTASGDYSTAIGQAASTNGHPGSFVYGDASTSTVVNSFNDNQFLVRASGGTYLWTSSDGATGCYLLSGSGSWNCVSSRRLKTDFAPLDGEAVLARVRELPVERWSYRSEPGVRHIGTYAEDFYRAFGLGPDSTTIGHLDMAGVNLAAVKALEQRTRDLQEQLSARDREITGLNQQVAELRHRLDRLEAARR